MRMPSLFVLVSILILGCKSHIADMENDLSLLIDSLEQQVRPLEEASKLAYFNASISGKAEDYEKASELNIRLSKIYSDKTIFNRLRQIKESGEVSDPLLKRQLEILFNTFLSNQLDEKKLEEIIRAEMNLEERFSTYRASFNDKELTDNEVESILKNSTDNYELKQVWLASKQIGDSVAPSVLNLVRMRNEAARELGFENYHQMSLRLSEQDPGQIEQLFDELDLLTKDAYTILKSRIDSFLSLRYNVPPEALMPWHYQNRFFQEAPAIYNINLDDYYKKNDVVLIAEDYYAGIGLDVASVLAKSDLYEKEGKYQHAYCTSIDRSRDVRIVCNVKNDAYWMNTMLHELGHAVYDIHIDSTLPFFLKIPAHIFATEAIANFFGRLSSNPYWIRSNTGISEGEARRISGDVHKNLQLEQLIFSRWSQVMFRFEKSMYEEPDQDLNQLWWSLVTQYQMVEKPEGRDNSDWASKIHIATVPCYYHNYLLGELLASQLLDHIETEVLNLADNSVTSLSGNPDIGQYLRESVFLPGARYTWNEMIKLATGEELTAKYYSEDFLDKN